MPLAGPASHAPVLVDHRVLSARDLHDYLVVGGVAAARHLGSCSLLTGQETQQFPHRMHFVWSTAIWKVAWNEVLSSSCHRRIRPLESTPRGRPPRRGRTGGSGRGGSPGAMPLLPAAPRWPRGPADHPAGEAVGALHVREGGILPEVRGVRSGPSSRRGMRGSRDSQELPQVPEDRSHLSHLSLHAMHGSAETKTEVTSASEVTRGA